MPATIAHALLDRLSEFGIRHIFGNPGTTELPLLDALAGDDRFQYILGLQEVPVMAMADGYAMASQSLGVVNLHISCGLGNAMGMLYNAYREGTPLLVTAGQQDRRLKFEEPILWGDMVAVAKPWTKWAAELNLGEDLPSALRRAVQTALTPPTGPVFLSIPIDIQMESAERLDTAPISLPDFHTRPPRQAITKAAELLAAAKHPVILAGSRITEADAVDELVAVAELLGAPVISEASTTHGRLPFPCDHPLYGQCLPLWSPQVRQRLNEFDFLLAAGIDLLRQYMHHEPARPIPEHIQLVQIDEDPWKLGKNYPLAAGIIGHAKIALAELAAEIRQVQTKEQAAAAQERAAQHANVYHKARLQLQTKISQQIVQQPMAPLSFMSAIAEALPNDVAVIEEAVTTTHTTLERLGALKNTSGYFGHRGWALGWGLGCAIGVQLAWPDRPVLAILGEGSAMYGIQGLWSAARYRLPVTFVVANNSQYQILKAGAQGLSLPQAMAGNYLGMDLIEPEIDFPALARSLGITAHRVDRADELTQRVKESLLGDEPVLLDVAIARETSGP